MASFEDYAKMLHIEKELIVDEIKRDFIKSKANEFNRYLGDRLVDSGRMWQIHSILESIEETKPKIPNGELLN